MTKTKYLTAPPHTDKMPASFPYILVNEAAERFSFYGMRCILTMFMVKYLLNSAGNLAVLSEEQAKTYFHTFVAAAYCMPLIGAIISDAWLGKYRTILFFSILYFFGFLTLAINNTIVGLGLGLTLVAVGTGVIKPCVSANVGDQFGKTNQHLIVKAYNWFYFSINVGAMISIFFGAIFLHRYGPKVAFGIPAVFMAIATIAFWMGRKKFVHVPPAGFKFVKETFSGEDLRVIGRLSIIYVFLVVFWALWDQMDSSWVLVADKMNRHIFGLEILPSQLSFLNALLILILIPIFAYLIYPALNKLFRLTALRKITIGFFVTASAFVVLALIQTRISDGEKPHIIWMLPAYIIITSAEVLVSITCLEFSYTQAPKKIKSFVMAVFLLSISMGNALAALVNKLIQNPDGTSKLAGASYFWFFTIIMTVTAVIFIFVEENYKEKTYIQDEAA